MLGYRYPSKLTEVVFCRRDPQPDGCQGGHGYDLDRQNIPISSLEVKSSGVGNNMGVFSTINIPASSYIGLEKLVHAVRVEPATYSHVLKWEKHFANKYAANVIKAYLHSYGSSMGSHVSVLPVILPSRVLLIANQLSFHASRENLKYLRMLQHTALSTMDVKGRTT